MVKNITTLLKAAEYLDRRDRGELSCISCLNGAVVCCPGRECHVTEPRLYRLVLKNCCNPAVLNANSLSVCL